MSSGSVFGSLQTRQYLFFFKDDADGDDEKAVEVVAEDNVEASESMLGFLLLSSLLVLGKGLLLLLEGEEYCC